MIDVYTHARAASVPGFRGHPCPRPRGSWPPPGPRLASFPRGEGRSGFETEAMFRAPRSLTKKPPKKFHLNPEPRQGVVRVCERSVVKTYPLAFL